jgi:hypothetical protein
MIVESGMENATDAEVQFVMDNIAKFKPSLNLIAFT